MPDLPESAQPQARNAGLGLSGVRPNLDIPTQCEHAGRATWPVSVRASSSVTSAPRGTTPRMTTVAEAFSYPGQDPVAGYTGLLRGKRATVIYTSAVYGPGRGPPSAPTSRPRTSRIGCAGPASTTSAPCISPRTSPRPTRTRAAVRLTPGPATWPKDSDDQVMTPRSGRIDAGRPRPRPRPAKREACPPGRPASSTIREYAEATRYSGVDSDERTRATSESRTFGAPKGIRRGPSREAPFVRKSGRKQAISRFTRPGV